MWFHFRTGVKDKVLTVFPKAQHDLLHSSSLTLLTHLPTFCSGSSHVRFFADPQIDLHTPCCQGTFVFTIPLLRHFPHRYPLGWLPHLLQVFAQMPSFRLIFHLKSYPPTQHASSPLPCIFFPQSIYHTMYLLFLVAVIYLLLLECKALWREGVFVSFLRCDIPAVLRPQWVFSEYLVNEREAYALCTRSPTFHLLMIHLTKLLVYFCYEGHFK